jgi:hypothetical protein
MTGSGALGLDRPLGGTMKEVLAKSRSFLLPLVFGLLIVGGLALITQDTIDIPFLYSRP